MPDYGSVYNANQGSFNNPRQKTLLVMQRGIYGWSIKLPTNSFDEAKGVINDLLRHGTKLDDVIMCELIPVDSMIIPSV